MDMPEPRLTDASDWLPPLPEASGFDHLVIETPGLRTHVATIGAGEPEDQVAMLCRTYESGDAEARKLTRMLAELSVAAAAD